MSPTVFTVCAVLEMVLSGGGGQPFNNPLGHLTKLAKGPATVAKLLSVTKSHVNSSSIFYYRLCNVPCSLDM